MRRNLLLVAAAAGLLTLPAVSLAQTFAAPEAAAIGYGGYGGYGHGYHSSTLEEGLFRGLGDLARSIGQADYMSSLAGINRQESLSRYLDNKEKYAETYFRMQQINRAAREAQRSQPLSAEQYAKLARQQGPDRLSDADYNRVVGRLAWPAVLAGDEFAAERAAIDKAFAGRRADDVGVSTSFYNQVRKLTDEMQEKLRASLGTMSSVEFIAAKKFLASVAHESHLPVAAAGLASAE
jgi:hypothetical protein